MKIGVLALQGAFKEHEKMLTALGVKWCEIRQAEDLSKNLNGIIIPGGESTVISKLLIELNMMDKLQHILHTGVPVFGTCAGLILLSKQICDDTTTTIGAMDIEVKRNAYGRQLGSFAATGEFLGIGTIPMVFIRAPYIKSVGKNVQVLCTLQDKIVAAKQENYLVTAFHPELTADLSVHKYFIQMVIDNII